MAGLLFDKPGESESLRKKLSKKKEQEPEAIPDSTKALNAARKRRLAEAEQREKAGLPYTLDMPKSSVDSLRQHLRSEEVSEEPEVPADPNGDNTGDSVTPVKTDPVKLKSPGDLSTFLSKLEKDTVGLDPKQSQEFQSALDDIKLRQGQAIQQYNKTKDRNQWLAMAETLGQALTRIGAGMYGLKKGINMGGLKLEKTDWSSNIDRAMTELDRNLSRLDKEAMGTVKEREGMEDKLQADKKSRDKALIQDFMTKRRAYQDQQLQAQRLADRDKQIAKKIEEAGDKAEQKKLKEEQKRLEAEKKRLVKEAEKKVQLFDKAYAEAQKDNVKLDKIGTILGGEKAAQLKEDLTSEGWFWDSVNEEEAPTILKGYLDQAKKHLNKLRGGEQSPEQSGPQPGDVVEGYKFTGGDPADPASWEEQ